MLNSGSLPTLVDPLLNRLAMESTDNSLHGCTKISFPLARCRRSIATCTHLVTSAHGIGRRTTTSMPQDAGPVKRVPAENWDSFNLAANKFFGGGPLRTWR